MSARRGPTARDDGTTGITRSRRHLDCALRSGPFCLYASLAQVADRRARYIVSYLAHVATRRPCNLAFLRLLNLLVNLLGIPFVSWRIQLILRDGRHVRGGKPRSQRSKGEGQSWSRQASQGAGYTASTIALFPVLFFFSALHYTDVMSTFTVLAAYWIQLCWNRQPDLRDEGPIAATMKGLAVVLTGLVSLSFRQTNIFWAAGFLGGLRLVERLNEYSASDDSVSGWAERPSLRELCQAGWSSSLLYDPAAADAYLEG